MRIKDIIVTEYRNPEAASNGKLIGIAFQEHTHEGTGTFRFFLTIEEARELVEKVVAKLNIKQTP